MNSLVFTQPVTLPSCLSPSLTHCLTAPLTCRRKLTAADILAMDLPAEVATLDGAIIKVEKTADGKLTVVGLRAVRWDSVLSRMFTTSSAFSTLYTSYTSFRALRS